MVLFFSSTALSADAPVILYMGKDKVENEDLIKYAWPQDVWFHVDKLSSAHVYLRMPESLSSWEEIPEALLTDCAQLVKANSIEGNKRDNITIIYTPASNLKKTGDMAVGQVSFKSDKQVKRVYVPKRENVIVNRLNKTKVERVVDHEQEQIDRISKEQKEKRLLAIAERKEKEQLAKQRAEEKAARDYALIDQPVDDDDDFENDSGQPKTVQEMMDDFM